MITEPLSPRLIVNRCPERRPFVKQSVAELVHTCTLLNQGQALGDRLSGIFGEIKGTAVITVLVQALICGSIHYQWGIGAKCPMRALESFYPQLLAVTATSFCYICSDF